MSVETLVVIGILVAAGGAVARHIWLALRPAKSTGPGCGGHASNGCGCGH